MARVPESVCVHLTLGPCPCGTNKGKSIIIIDDDEAENKLPAAVAVAAEHSTELMLCDDPVGNQSGAAEIIRRDNPTDPWKIKKKLTESDLGYLSRLLINKKLAEEVLGVLTDDARMEVLTENGTKLLIWDVDTQSQHELVFKYWTSSRSYVFNDNWTKDFVKRRGLKKGDEIKLHWDPNKNCFNFSVDHYFS